MILVLSIACAVSAAGDLDTGPQPRPARIFRASRQRALLALLSGLTALVTDSVFALRSLVGMTIALWAAAAIRHAATVPPER